MPDIIAFIMFLIIILCMLIAYLLIRVHNLQKDIDFLVEQNHLALMSDLKRDIKMRDTK